MMSCWPRFTQPARTMIEELELQCVLRRERTPVRMPEVDRRARPCPLLVLGNRSRFGSADFWHRTRCWWCRAKSVPRRISERFPRTQQ